MEASVRVVQLSHAYNSHLAVDRVSFEIAPGTTFGLIGPNGAGKSTTIKMLTTLLPVTSGEVWINGFDLKQQPTDVRRSIGYVPQMISADGELTGYENLLLSAKLYGLPHQGREERITDVLSFMGLQDVASKRVQHYSGGMIRRLEIAQALVHQPPVLFLDEPTVGLDPAARHSLWKLIQSLNQKWGTTISMATRDMDEADLLCDKVALMHMGHIILMDAPHQLKSALGPEATLDDVFIFHTGSSLKETGDYQHVKQTRHTISNL